tara:strand:- start:3650 stop:3835 length:186 start_codon:yes stop_codon:yes gene_type:complete
MMTRKDFEVFAEEIGKAMPKMMAESDQLVMFWAVTRAAERCNENFDPVRFKHAVTQVWQVS